ncbi:MAG: translation elongation factor Ts [Patescibacteria group bacterium]
MNISMEELKKLRAETGAGVMEAKKALEQHGSFEKAKGELIKLAGAKAEKKADRIAKEGLIYSYIHTTGKVGSLVEINCETDFVAKTEDFKKLCHEICMQACAMPFESVEELVNQDYIRDGSKKVSDLIKEAVAKLGENIKVARASRFKIGQ